MAFAAVRHDPVASPQDGTPTKQVSDKTRLRNRCGSLWARMHRQTERSKRGIMRLDFNIVFDCRIGGIYVLSVKHRCRASTPFAYAKAPFLHTLQKNFCPKWKSF